jgi:dolichol kinase
MLAIGLAAGAVLLVGGLLGGWVRWLLGGRDPWLWVLRGLTNGRRPWSRLTLVAWWGLLGSLSVAGWNRQLARSRRHSHIHAYTSAATRTPTQSQFKPKTATVAPISEVSAVGTYPPLVPRLGTLQAQAQSNAGQSLAASLGPAIDIQAVATDLLDAADKHVPTLSRNGRRKFFHALAVLMFVPGISWDVSRSRSSAMTRPNICLSPHLPTWHSALRFRFLRLPSTSGILPYTRSGRRCTCFLASFWTKRTAAQQS